MGVILSLAATLRCVRHFAICGILVFGPACFFAPPAVWKLDPQLWIVLGGATVAYLLAAFTVQPPAADAAQPFGRVLLSFFAFFGAWVLGIMLWESGMLGSVMPIYRREALVLALVIGFFGLLLTTYSKPTSWPGLVVIGIAGFAALAAQAAFHKHWLPRPPQPTRAVAFLDTSVYQLQVTRYADAIPDHWRSGGGLAAWGDDYLVVTGDGRLFIFNENKEAKALHVTALPYGVPLNAAEFVAGAQEIFKNTPGKNVDSGRFRVAGILMQDLGDTRRLLVAHHHWDVANACFTLRLSVLEGTPAQFLAADAPLKWRTAYDAVPCLKLNTTNPRGPRFEGLENGGHMVALGRDEILMSIGDHGFDGVTRPERLPQDPNTTYGKIIHFNLASGAARIFTSGHRNPQGLHITDTGEIWAPEHGPRGGDELNKIVDGKDYGWPSVTLGTDYSRRLWPLNPVVGRHDEFERPIYAFVPSVGVSTVTSVTSDRLSHWKGDLLVGSLRAQTLFRVRVRDDRVVFVEPMYFGLRIRDVRLGNDGRLLLWTDESTIVFIEPTDVNRGESVAAQCLACHSFAEFDASTTLGPNLSSVVGRRVGSRRDFAYSAAMKQHGGRWTVEALDAFLADPQAEVPGTAMAFGGIPDAEQRRLLIQYLGNPAPNE